jgi:hypothetical protein
MTIKNGQRDGDKYKDGYKDEYDKMRYDKMR